MSTTATKKVTDSDLVDLAVGWVKHDILKIIDTISSLSLEELDKLEDGWPELPHDHQPQAEIHYQNGVVELIYHFRQVRFKEKELEQADE